MNHLLAGCKCRMFSRVRFELLTGRAAMHGCLQRRLTHKKEYGQGFHGVALARIGRDRRLHGRKVSPPQGRSRMTNRRRPNSIPGCGRARVLELRQVVSHPESSESESGVLRPPIKAKIGGALLNVWTAISGPPTGGMSHPLNYCQRGAPPSRCSVDLAKMGRSENGRPGEG